MILYVLICLCLTLTGVSGMLIGYLYYLDRLDHERKKRIYELEHKCRTLTYQLKEARAQIRQQEEMLESLYSELGDEEAWADVIDDR